MDARWRPTHRAIRLTVSGLLVFDILNPAVLYGGYVLVGGKSMAPAILAGCRIARAHSWDGTSSSSKGTIGTRLTASSSRQRTSAV